MNIISCGALKTEFVFSWQVITYRIAMVRVSNSEGTDKDKYAQKYFKEPISNHARLRTDSGTALPTVNSTGGDTPAGNPVKAIELGGSSDDGSSRTNSGRIASGAGPRSVIRGLLGADGEPVREELSDHNEGNFGGSETDLEVIYDDFNTTP